MRNWNEQIDGLVGIIETMRKRANHRELIAIAGPSGSGKTTLAKTLSDRLAHCSYLSMDGFHLDNPILIQKGLRERKGAPETFDVAGFMHLIQRLRRKEEVYVPDFDRQTERTVNCAYPVPNHHDLVIVEGNYLLLDEPVWRDLDDYWDLAVFVQIGLETIKTRLMQRYKAHGFDEETSARWIESNDIPNAERVLKNRVPEDVTLNVPF
ncbi:AAA family ATPase [Litorivicinus sp.]|nr:AAA family ATPase [Litorivicinus sp.]